MDKEIMAKAYEHSEAEMRWYKFWEENGLFKANPDSEGESFCIVIPPPNVTGTLHMGHALNNTLQDILCRYKKMKGFKVLWQPGTDHAGIATQNVVERSLAEQGSSRHEVGRERFIELVWEWREKYGGLILNQLKRLGCCCDWSRERFTMDDGLSRAVKEVFVRLYEEGLIYRGDYIINWCPRCHTALADIEVEHEERDSFLYHIRYPFEKSDGYVVVATTRPETLLGDTAVAVNPEDERYSGISDENVLLPVMDRPIPIIHDKYVDMSFGTGALKITPAHDINDFEIGNSHGLDRIRVIDENGKMNELAGSYEGMDRFECREKILEELKDKGLLEEVEPYRNSVGHCYRCKTMIEPLLSKQWFVRTKPLAEKAIKAVEDSSTQIFPSNWETVYFEWMRNIRDWCVSRQIWWGHRIPAWYCQECDEIHVGKEAPEKCKACGNDTFNQETDVLDTWFSSGLWPFSTLGWPDSTKELNTYYPTSVLVTGFDILFFWVARMMMMGLHFMEEVPFRSVYIHALVRDADGKKMSKSKGNVIDPLVVMDEFGTDAFRFTLAALAAPGRDIKLSEERIMGYRHFVNKLWNAARFFLMNTDGSNETEPQAAVGRLEDRWILTRLSRVSAEINHGIADYRFNDAAALCYQFVWHEVCDWYLEMAKERLYGDDPAARATVVKLIQDVLNASLRLLHPFMPFVTEEIWNKFPATEGSIMNASFPEEADFPVDEKSLEEMQVLTDIITGIRNIRGEMNIPPSKKLKVVIDSPEGVQKETLMENSGHIRTLAKIESLYIESGVAKPEASATSVYGDIQAHVLLKGLIDFEDEKKRIRKEISKIEKEMAVCGKKLASEGFLKKAPEEVVNEVRRKAEEGKERLEKLNSNLNFFEAIDD